MRPLLLAVSACLVLLPAWPSPGQSGLPTQADVCLVTFNVPPHWESQVKDAARGCTVALRPAGWRKTRSVSDTQYLDEWPVSMTVFHGDLAAALKQAGFVAADGVWGVSLGEGTASGSQETYGVWSGIRAEPNRRYNSKRGGYAGQGNDVVVAATAPGGLALSFHFQLLDLTSTFDEKVFLKSVIPRPRRK
jgi:hypothetical protein